VPIFAKLFAMFLKPNVKVIFVHKLLYFESQMPNFGQFLAIFGEHVSKNHSIGPWATHLHPGEVNLLLTPSHGGKK
jgi:hypothetical protein